MSTSVYSAENKDDFKAKSTDGVLLLPDNYKSEDKKTCMTVCKRWGKDCILINKGEGGVERRCRQVCESLGEECF